MKNWQDVANEVVVKLEARSAALEKELKRARISVQALMNMRAVNHAMVMSDADWRVFETAMLISGYAIVRFGLTHVGIVSLNSVNQWPRVRLRDDNAGADE